MSRSCAPLGSQPWPDPSNARAACIEAAYAIAKLIQLYERRYSLRRMNILGVGITCSAALLLVFASVTQQNRATTKELAPQLSACFRALDDMSAGWESAKRAREFLILLQRRWKLQGGGSQKVRLASQIVSGDSGPVKRSRTDSTNGLGHREHLLASSNIAVKSPQSTGFSSNKPVDMAMGLDPDWIFADTIENYI